MCVVLLGNLDFHDPVFTLFPFVEVSWVVAWVCDEFQRAS